MAAVDFENLIDTIEQKIVSNQKTILTKKELVKNVLETIKPISLRAFMKYLSSHTEFDGKRNLNKLLKADFTG
jgi:transcriptional regulator NrdR family protein